MVFYLFENIQHMSVISKNGRREQTYFLMDLFCVTGRPLHSITFIALTNETEFKAGDDPN